MCRSYESAVHRPRTPHSVPLTLQVIVSDVYQQIVTRVAAESRHPALEPESDNPQVET